ncbi:hypothetical protein [Amnibacterium kyonggiense]
MAAVPGPDDVLLLLDRVRALHAPRARGDDRADGGEAAGGRLPDELVALEASYGLRIRRTVVAVFVVAAIVLSVFFFPISAGLPVPYWFWHIHMWSPTWI